MSENKNITAEKKPWPMPAVAAAIVVSLVLYTVMTLGFRKPGAAHEPYAEAMERQAELRETSMLEWTRFPVELRAANDESVPMSNARLATVTTQPTPHRLDKSLPVELVLVTPAQPSLYPGLAAVEAATAFTANETLEIDLHPGDQNRNFGEPWVFAKEHQLHVFIQDDGRLPKNLTPVPAADRMTLSLAPDTLAPGKWNATLYTGAETFSWTFAVE